VVGVYDGDAADVGRVVVDSTWHHWMDMNLVGLEAATPDTDYQKIVRYFRNCAVWLSRSAQRQAMLRSTAFLSVLTSRAVEDLVLTDSVWNLGATAFDILGRRTSDCLVHDWVISLLDPVLVDAFDLPFPEPCWSCPPLDLLEQAVLGGITQNMLKLRKKLHVGYAEPDAEIEIPTEVLREALASGADAGIAAFREAVHANLEPLERVGSVANRRCRVRLDETESPRRES